LNRNRRRFIRSLSRATLVLPFADILAAAGAQQSKLPGPIEREYHAKAMPAAKGPKSPIEGTPLGVSFVDVVKECGLAVKTIYGGEHKNKYLLETTGCGLAFYDYDNDGCLDVLLVNGWRLEGFPPGQEPHCHLFKNNRDGTFTDVTKGSGLEHKTGWGQACCVGDYDNDGHDDLFVTYYGQNVLYRNNGNGTFTDVTKQAGLIQPGPKTRWNTGCTFVDYDKDGHLDLFVANYVDLDLKTAPPPEAGPCTYKGLLVACGPPGLPGGKNILYHNNGNGTFTDVSEKAGIWKTAGTYGLSVAASDLDNDGWPDIYVANDSSTASLYQNQKDGTFKDIAIEAGAALSPEGKPQAGMGVSIGDYNRDGTLDVVKTNFAGDTDSLYTNLGDGNFEDRTYPSGLGVNTRLLGWGVGFFDMDNDGWLDILVFHGGLIHLVPQEQSLFRGLGNGKFADVSREAGPKPGRCARVRPCARCASTIRRSTSTSPARAASSATSRSRRWARWSKSSRPAPTSPRRSPPPSSRGPPPPRRRRTWASTSPRSRRRRRTRRCATSSRSARCPSSCAGRACPRRRSSASATSWRTRNATARNPRSSS